MSQLDCSNMGPLGNLTEDRLASPERAEDQRSTRHTHGTHPEPGRTTPGPDPIQDYLPSWIVLIRYGRAHVLA